MQKRFGLILSVVLALLAVFLVKVYLDQQSAVIREKTKQELIKRQERLAPVLLALQDIPKGTAIESSMFEEKVIPREFIQPQAVSSPERIAGLVTVVPISKGEQITLNKLLSPQQARGGSLAMATPVGKRAIAISIDNISSLMGMIRPGDYVDVIAMIPVPVQTPDEKQTIQPVIMPLFQNIQVLAVGQEMGKLSAEEGTRYGRGEQKEGSPLITLALSPQEANLIAFVQEQGKLRLTLRSPADSRIEPIMPANWDTLFQYIMPPAQLKEQAAPLATPTERTIEIYRGLKKEIVPVSK